MGLFASCEMPQDPNPPGDKMNGLITFIDTNITRTGGFYAISLYSADSSSPFNRVPIRSDSLVLIMRENRIYESLYATSGIAEGRYYIASTWVRYPRVANEVPRVLGTYACDTAHTCTNHIVIAYPNYQGVYRNILSLTH